MHNSSTASTVEVTTPSAGLSIFVWCTVCWRRSVDEGARYNYSESPGRDREFVRNQAGTVIMPDPAQKFCFVNSRGRFGRRQSKVTTPQVRGARTASSQAAARTAAVNRITTFSSWGPAVAPIVNLAPPTVATRTLGLAVGRWPVPSIPLADGLRLRRTTR